MNKISTEKPPYSILADIYDEVMTDVDYETWTDYIDDIIIQHTEKAVDILELACGTGTMALSLEELDCYNITATDGSADMIRIAQKKAEEQYSKVNFTTMNFLDLNFQKKFDVAYMVFDSLNYLHSEKDILQLHKQVKSVLKPDGIFIYDFTTPRNSRTAINFLDHEKKTIHDEIRYFRRSTYDPKNRIHTNSFFIDVLDRDSKKVIRQYKEQHQQRIYTLWEIELMIKKTDFSVLAAYDGFELKPAHRKSLRITMVLQ